MIAHIQSSQYSVISAVFYLQCSVFVLAFVILCVVSVAQQQQEEGLQVQLGAVFSPLSV